MTQTFHLQKPKLHFQTDSQMPLPTPSLLPASRTHSHRMGPVFTSEGRSYHMLTEPHLQVVARILLAAGPFFGISQLSADPAMRPHSAVPLRLRTWKPPGSRALPPGCSQMCHEFKSPSPFDLQTPLFISLPRVITPIFKKFCLTTCPLFKFMPCF